MEILGAREEHELFENCFRGGKKLSARNYKKGSKISKVKFLAQSPSQILVGPII